MSEIRGPWEQVADKQDKLADAFNDFRTKDLVELRDKVVSTQVSTTHLWGVAGLLLVGVFGASGWSVWSNSGLSREIGVTATELKNAQRQVTTALGKLESAEKAITNLSGTVRQDTEVVARVEKSLLAVTKQLEAITTDTNSLKTSTVALTKRLNEFEIKAEPTQTLTMRLRLTSKELKENVAGSLPEGVLVRFVVTLLATVQPERVRQTNVQLELSEDERVSLGNTAARGTVSAAGELTVEIIVPAADKAESLKKVATDKGIAIVASIVIATEPAAPAKAG